MKFSSAVQHRSIRVEQLPGFGRARALLLLECLDHYRGRRRVDQEALGQKPAGIKRGQVGVTSHRKLGAEPNSLAARLLVAEVNQDALERIQGISILLLWCLLLIAAPLRSMFRRPHWGREKPRQRTVDRRAVHIFGAGVLRLVEQDIPVCNGAILNRRIEKHTHCLTPPGLITLPGGRILSVISASKMDAVHLFGLFFTGLKYEPSCRFKH
jgi:hypothetical protein